MTGGRSRAAVRALTLLVAVVMALLVGAGPAAAHSELERSDPPDGGTVAVGRTNLTLWFGEPVSLDGSTFALHAADGTAVDVTTASDGGEVVRLTAPPLPRGTFVVEWRAMSLDDGHVASGTVVFGVGLRPSVVPSSETGPPEVPGVVLRWLDLSALLVAIGALSVSGRVIGALGGSSHGLRRSIRVIGAAAAAAAVATGALTPLALAWRADEPVSVWVSQVWSTVTGTPWGRLWLAREVALLVAAALLWSWAQRPDRASARVRGATAALVVAAALETGAGHVSTLPVRVLPAAVAGTAHLLAAGVWAGGLVVLVVCLVPPTRRDPRFRGAGLAPVWRAFSPRAAGASVVLLATGLYEAGRHVPAPGSLTSSVYGGAVAAKTLLVLLALSLAAVNTLVVNPGAAARVGRLLGRPAGWAPVSVRRFAVVVTAEAAVLVLAAGAAAVLTSVPTSREVANAAAVTAPAHGTTDGLFITVEEVRAGPDLSTLVVRVRSVVLPDPAPVVAAEVRLAGPGGQSATAVLTPVEEGRYEAEVAAPGPGAWSADVVLHRQGRPDTLSTLHWTVAAPATDAVDRLELLTTAAAVALLAALSAGVWVYRRRAAPPVPTDAVPARPLAVAGRAPSQESLKQLP